MKDLYILADIELPEGQLMTAITCLEHMHSLQPLLGTPNGAMVSHPKLSRNR